LPPSAPFAVAHHTGDNLSLDMPEIVCACASSHAQPERRIVSGHQHFLDLASKLDDEVEILIMSFVMDCRLDF